MLAPESRSLMDRAYPYPSILFFNQEAAPLVRDPLRPPFTRRFLIHYVYARLFEPFTGSVFASLIYRGTSFMYPCISSNPPVAMPLRSNLFR